MRNWIALGIGRVGGIVGPLFTKELLVTSRRPRYYLLRFAYASLLGLFIALVWLAFIESARSASAAYRIAHMSRMGERIVSFIVCFQFGAAQFVAIVLLSASISEEIYRRTLVPILTTPIGYGQIVLGKFLGKLLHVGVLLAISLPLMGMVRVLGGVPWGYLLSGLCITVTAVALTGSVALFFSVLCRRAYLSILASLGVVVVLYGLVGLVLLMVGALACAVIGGNVGMNLVLYPNPVAAMVYETWVLNDPSVRVPGFYWPVHCLLMGVLTWLMLKFCEILIRRLALRKAIGLETAPLQTPGPPLAVPVIPPGGATPVLMPVGTGPVVPARATPAGKKRRWKPKGWNFRNVVVSPIVWRELRKPLLRDKVVQIVATCATLLYLLYTYAILGASGSLAQPTVHAGFVATFLLLGMACTAMDAATSIAPEKRARTWPALLSTPVSDWHVLLGKAGGTLFRCLPVWLFLLGHVVVFTAVGILHPIALLHVFLLAAWTSIFLAGAGVYFSTRCRRATTAVLMNLALALLLWALIPAGAGLVGEVFGDYELSIGLAQFNPVVQAVVVAEGGANGLRYDWPDSSYRRWPATTLILLASTIGYGLAGAAFAWRAKRLFRKNVFDS